MLRSAVILGYSLMDVFQCLRAIALSVRGSDRFLIQKNHRESWALGLVELEVLSVGDSEASQTG